MGETAVEIQVAGKRKKQRVRVLVDTGATLTVISGKILQAIGIKPQEKVEVDLADGRVVKRSVGEAKIFLDGKQLTTRVLFGEKTDAQVLGTVVLEELGLAVDPVRKHLIPVRFLFIFSRVLEPFS